MVRIRELPPAVEEPPKRARGRPAEEPKRARERPAEEAEEPQEPEEPKSEEPARKMGRPRKPDSELKYPRRTKPRAPKPKEEARPEEERPLPLEAPREEAPRDEGELALMQEFLGRFGSAQKRQGTERRERYRALLRNHYGT